MKRRRNMLLCVTATSMAATLGCTPAAQPVGIVGRPDYMERDAGSEEDAMEAAAPVDDSPVVGRSAHVPDAGPPPFHPDRVGTTAVVDDSPSVGTTAHVPDKKK